MSSRFINDPEYDQLILEIRRGEVHELTAQSQQLREESRALVAESRRARQHAQAARARSRNILQGVPELAPS